MPRPSHSPAARSGHVFEPDSPAINSSRARVEQRHRAANTPPPPKRHQIAVCPGPSASWLAQFRRTHGHGCAECAEDWGDSPYDRDGPRHVSHGFVTPPVSHPYHRYSETDSPPPRQRGRPYHRTSSYDATDGELEFDRHGRFGDYSPPPYHSANVYSCFDNDVYGSHLGYKSPFESESLLPIFGAKSRAPSPDSRSRDRENHDTNLNRSDRSRSLRRARMEPLPVSLADYFGLEPRKDHERDSIGSPLIKYPDYTDLERRNLYGRNNVIPLLGSYPDHEHFERRKDHDSRRTGVRPAGRHLTGHRFETDSEADELEDNVSGTFIHRPRPARPRGHHSDSDVGSIDTDTEEEYFKHIRDFDSVDDAIADRYTGRLRAPTAAEKTHRRYLVSLSKDFDTQYLRAEQARAELWLLERQDTHIALSDTEKDSIRESVARQIRKTNSSGMYDGAADFNTSTRKPSPCGRRDDQKSDSESVTPQPQDSHPQVRCQVAAAHPITTNHNPSPHKNPSQPRSAPDRPTQPQNPHSNTNTTLPNDQAPPSYDSVSPAQVTDSVQPDPVNHTPRSPLATAATDSTPPNITNAGLRSYVRNPNIKNLDQRALFRAALVEKNIITARPQQAVRTSPGNKLHTSPAELGTNNNSDSSGSGVATPISSDDDDSWLESAGDRLGAGFISR